MTSLAEKLIAQGRARGEAIGEARGEAKVIAIAQRMLDEGSDLPFIVKVTGLSLQKIKDLQNAKKS